MTMTGIAYAGSVLYPRIRSGKKVFRDIGLYKKINCSTVVSHYKYERIDEPHFNIA